MEISVAIHKDEDSVYGVIVPDLPGCFSWGDTLEDAMKNAREAIYGHVEALLIEGMQVRIAQSRIEDLATLDDYAGALWALVQVDLSKLDPKRLPSQLNQRARVMNLEHIVFHVIWSPQDGEYVGLCSEFPSLSWLGATPGAALGGIRQLVAESVADLLANEETVP